MKGQITALAALAGLAGCATTPGETAAAPEARMCDAAPAQQHVGKTASEATGTAILAASGARSLRWGPPNGAWTMDYRQDRVNVRYDAAMTIIDITCG